MARPLLFMKHSPLIALAFNALAFTGLSFTGLACHELVPAPARDRPEIEVTSPAEGQAIAFDTPFVVEATARAPEGASITRVELVLSGAASAIRRIDATGPNPRVEASLIISGAGHLGTDRLPVELIAVSYAIVGGTELASEPDIVPLGLVDRTRPELEVSLTPESNGAGFGFDHLYDAGERFAISVIARDPIGGIRRLAIEAPPFLGGDRSRELEAVPSASLEVAFEPPENADFELRLRAEDAAFEPNVTERVLRIRVGAGGEDALSPAISFIAPTTAECGVDLAVTALATDDASGVERLSFSGPGFAELAYGPDPDHPLTLLSTATIAVPGDAAIGSFVEVSAEARDLAGNNTGTRSLSIPVDDTRAPLLEAVLAPDPVVVPGELWSATIQGREVCGTIAEARAVFSDGIDSAVAPAVAINDRRVDRRISFEVPEALCTVDPITTSVALADERGLVSPPTVLVFAAVDAVPPIAGVVHLAPPNGISPGETIEAEGHAVDAQTPIRSATVTVTPIDLDWPAIEIDSATWSGSTCADRGTRAIPFALPVPPDVRYFAPIASVRVNVDAEDAAGNVGSAVLDIPIVDLAPPLLSVTGPADGSIVVPGASLPLSAAVSDVNHDVDSVVITAIGPAWIDSAGVSSATIAVGAASGTAGVSVLIDPNAAFDARIAIVVSARDTSPTAPAAVETIELFACGAPALSGVDPAFGPIAGGNTVRLFGDGFAEGITSFTIAGVELTNVLIEGAGAASATIPAGTYAAGFAAVEAINACGASPPSATLAAGYRFVAPPSLAIVRPRTGATAAAGEEIAVAIAAAGDGVALSSVEARLAGGAPVTRTVTTETFALDEVLVVPAGATGSIALIAGAVDALGQNATLSAPITIGAPAPVGVELVLERAMIATGESIGAGAIASWSDGRARDATDICAFASSAPAIADVSAVGSITGGAAGEATISVTCGAFSDQRAVEVFDRALVFAHGEVLISSRAGSGAARLEVLLLEAGRAIASPGSVVWTSTDPLVATVAGGVVTAAGAGETTITAVYTPTTGPTLLAPITVRAAPSLDVASGERWWIAGGQRFAGGLIDGEAIALRPEVPQGEWSLEIEPGGVLELGASGVLRARGAIGSSAARGGRGGAGAGGGGAATLAGGASGGFGEPPGASTPDDAPSTPGGDGGAIDLASRGRGAIAGAGGSAGAGGGAAGQGSDGGRASAEPAASGGAARSMLTGGGAGGGGGHRGGGGGGGGARVVLTMPAASLVLRGAIDASGGDGGARIGAIGTPGGGGGGGSIVIDALEVQGSGRLIARGGAGGAVSGSANRGSGGGGGGGAIVVTAAASDPHLDVDVEGGGTSAATTNALRGSAGRRGGIAR